LYKLSAARFVPVIALLGAVVAACAGIQKIPERITAGATFGRLYTELKRVADVERVDKKELILRFPQGTLFRVDEYALRAEAEHNLENVASILHRYPQFTIIVEGHTDNRGRDSYNQWLSERRSRIVADMLVRKGLDPHRLQVVGYGESRPIATNETPEGRQRNRRVEIHIIPRQL